MPLPKGYWISRGGRKFSEAHIEHLRTSHLGQVHSPEAREKISKKLRGRKSHLYKDGRTSRPGYRAWQKNENNRRKRANGGSHTWKEWIELKQIFNNTCPGCGLPEPTVKLTQDHIIPLSKGGTNDIKNIQPLCLTCNLKKGTKLIRFSPLFRNPLGIR